ncbi:cysteine desulfuration protein SufE [Allopseudospirillum japonicum]|uniref:Cysteine desulfuration protein SufE n=1 Tax=Allopseudospirillum japonicum TaxID=64971 RepID=A0A1H6S915_9GAMM|nr:SufE family protein [Allopseudospirillum japonicum]SEI64421.1 cysteine desulfuration protein SufE [Allopseudospirillum japonicum]
MSTFTEAQAALLDEFSFFDNWMDKYQYIIDLGKTLPAFPQAYQTPEYKIEGCQSNVWMHIELQEGQLHIQATSDAAIVSGLIALLLRLYDGQTPADIMATRPEDFLSAFGLDKHLSPTRSNGLAAMLQQIYTYAQQTS